jgi:hypothetical protein
VLKSLRDTGERDNEDYVVRPFCFRIDAGASSILIDPFLSFN